jgi:hypothetical protein
MAEIAWLPTAAIEPTPAPSGQAAGRPVAEVLPGTPTRLMRIRFVKSVVSDGRRFKSTVLGSGSIGMIRFV